MTPPDDPTNNLRPYIELVTTYVEGGISAEEFEKRCSEQYLNDDTNWSDEQFGVLDSLFADTDFFEPDPTVRAEVEHTIDEGVLHARASQALTKLRKLTAGPDGLPPVARNRVAGFSCCLSTGASMGGRGYPQIRN